MATATIVVAGASGNLGGRIVRMLEGRGATVRAVRHTETDLAGACAGAACVVSAVQGLRDAIVDFQRRLLEAAVAAGVPRFIPSDYSTDFTPLPPGENRNFDLRREFHAVAEGKGIALTSIYNGAFAEVLGYGSPLLDREKRSCGYLEDPDWLLDFTTMDDTAAFTAAAALDARTPRALHCASFQVTPRDLAAAASDVFAAKFDVQKLSDLAPARERTKQMRIAHPEGENETFPHWQRLQYTQSMFMTHHATLENTRYPELTWTPAREFLKTLAPR